MISIYKGSNGPYRAFRDDEGAIYVIDRMEIVSLKKKLAEQLDGPVDPNLVNDSWWTRHDEDRLISDIQVIGEGMFEVISNRMEPLVISQIEASTLLNLEE